MLAPTPLHHHLYCTPSSDRATSSPLLHNMPLLHCPFTPPPHKLSFGLAHPTTPGSTKFYLSTIHPQISNILILSHIIPNLVHPTHHDCIVHLDHHIQPQMQHPTLHPAPMHPCDLGGSCSCGVPSSSVCNLVCGMAALMLKHVGRVCIVGEVQEEQIGGMGGGLDRKEGG